MTPGSAPAAASGNAPGLGSESGPASAARTRTAADGSPLALVGLDGQPSRKVDSARTSANAGERTADDSSAPVRSDLASDEFLEVIPRDFARAHLVFSQGRHDGSERLAIAGSTSPWAVFNVGVRLGVTVQTMLVSGEAIAQAIDEAYGRIESRQENEDIETSASSEEIDRLLAEADRDLLSTQGKGPIVKLVDALLFEALTRRASDVHVQPLADRTLVRYRLDGVLHTVRELPLSLLPGVVSRIKVMGRMDIAERRVPQDGRASVTIGGNGSLPIPETTDSATSPGAVSSSGGGVISGGRSVDLRISTLPTSHGERAVIRLLDNTTHLCDFERLGMPPEVAQRYLEHARRSNGIILLTGPTGSGKTTTLYATLRRIGSPDLNIMTVEDPVEYELSSLGLPISQSQVNLRKGVTFATGLRHILRQDPDVVMVGEIRDLETARIAIQSSLTGHLVFSTLHTNDAASAVTRLIDLGIEPYLVSASLSAIMAQRLVRLIHRPCRGEGCEACFGTGYSGRRGLFELLSVNEAVRKLISEGAAVGEIRGAALAAGMHALADEGQALVEAGQTSELEVRRVVQVVA